MHRWVGFTETGDTNFDDVSVYVDYSYVNLYQRTETTSIRTDKTGSKSRAWERTARVRIMVHPKVRPKFNDEIELDGMRFRVVEVFPRYEMSKILNHYQVDLDQSQFHEI